MARHATYNYAILGGLILFILILGQTEAVSNEEATDNSLAWTTGGNANWFAENSKYYYGGDASQSGKISHKQEAWMQTKVTGPGTLKFYWKVSSERNYDYLKFYVDSGLKARISGEVNWAQKTYTIPAGTHTLKWVYSKDRSTVRGSDAGWVDKVEYTPSGSAAKDNPPSVSVSRSQTESGTYILTASATDDKGLSEITIYSDGENMMTCTVSGTSASCPYAEQFAAGDHSYYATAKDIAGKTVTSLVGQLTVSLAGIPSLSLSHEQSGDMDPGTFIITASATGDTNLTEISVYVDDAPGVTCTVSGTSASCPYAEQLSAGTHSYYATALNDAGSAVTSQPVQFEVQ